MFQGQFFFTFFTQPIDMGDFSFIFINDWECFSPKEGGEENADTEKTDHSINYKPSSPWVY